ncbi:ABC transporter transmembrane domain-containing protein [Streptomyces sp. NPDC054866]
MNSADGRGVGRQPHCLSHTSSSRVRSLTTVAGAAITAASPLLLKMINDDGIVPREEGTVVGLALLVAALALVEVVAAFTQTWFSGRVGQGIVYDLRCQVFEHVQRQPLAFFTRTRTGALVSRLNTGVIGAQRAITTLLSQTVSTLLTLVLVLATVIFLSWQITLAALVMIPFFLAPAIFVGRRLQRSSP